MQITNEQIDAIFADAQSVGDAVVSLYKLVHPDFDQIAQFNGYPTISKSGWLYIAEQCQRLSHRVHIDTGQGGFVTNGGLIWMNNGFGHDESLVSDPMVNPTLHEVNPCPADQITYNDIPKRTPA